MNQQLFRKKSVDKVSSPEQLNEYIRVANPGVWMVLAAIVILLTGVVVWGFIGHLDTTLNTAVVCENGEAVIYVKEADIEKVPSMEATPKPEDLKRLSRMINLLEENEDVQKVHHNCAVELVEE